MSAPTVEEHTMNPRDIPIVDCPSFLHSELPSELHHPPASDNLPVMFYGFVVPGEVYHVQRRVNELGLAKRRPEVMAGKCSDDWAFFLLMKYIWSSWPDAVWTRVLRRDCNKSVLFLALCSNEKKDTITYKRLFRGLYGNEKRHDGAVQKAREALGFPADIQPRWYFGSCSKSCKLPEYIRQASGEPSQANSS
ncbi:hypothetical protein FKP32DRAFT_1587405 [Trametes sanguinea]|nr:hypothetical protein FKP32DRAFT_1587405 [Trametes sanguinea]